VILSTLLLAALLGSNATGKTLVRSCQGTVVQCLGGSNVLAWFPFSTTGCWPTGSAMGTKGQTITVSRTGTATYANAAGTIATCQANEARVGCDPTNLAVCGLLVEPARTNYVLNSATHPKTTEATGSLSTGAHVAWHVGTDPMSVTTGTAVATGLSCSSVSAGTVCAFTVTSAGTMLITTGAGVTHAQIENGTYRTSQIATAGTATARSADAISIANPLAATNPATWCVEGTYAPAEASWAGGQFYLWSIGAAGSSPSAWAGKGTGVAIVSSNYKNSAGTTIGSGNATASGVPCRIQTERIGSQTIAMKATTTATSSSTAPDWTSAPANLCIGYGCSAAPLQAFWIRDLKVSKGVCR